MQLPPLFTLQAKTASCLKHFCIRTELQKLHFVQKHKGMSEMSTRMHRFGNGLLTHTIPSLTVGTLFPHLGTITRLKQHTLASYSTSSVNEKYSSPSLHRVFCLTRQTLFAASRHTFSHTRYLVHNANCSISLQSTYLLLFCTV